MNYQDAICFGPRTFAAKAFPHAPCLIISDDQRVDLPYTVSKDGRTHLKLYYPNAHAVSIFDSAGMHDLQKENDYWILDADLGAGYQAIRVQVDGNWVLDPYLPIGFGDSQPFNFVDIPDGHDLWEIKDVPHGVVCADYLSNPVTGMPERVQIYLPPQYFTEPDRKFPVLYLQHGIGENETVWVSQGRVHFILDNLIAEGKAAPMVVVMCCGMLTEWEENQSTVHYDKFPEFLIGTVAPRIENRFRVYADAAHRAMAGLSMGSIQTSRTVMAYPDRFSAFGLFSGFFSDPLMQDASYITDENMAALKAISPIFFRAMGESDLFMPFFQMDDKLLEQNGVEYIRKTYPGQHEWNVWRRCITDFLPLIFKEEK